MGLTNTMPYPVRTWLGEHLDRVLEQVRRGNVDEKDRICGQLSLMRGLARFIPPEVDLKASHGLQDLRQAVALGTPQSAAIYSRLSRFIGSTEHMTINLADTLRKESTKFSVIAQEELRDIFASPEDIPETTDEGKDQALGLTTDDEPGRPVSLQEIAFLRTESSAAAFLDKVEQPYKIEYQLPFVEDKAAGGSINYGPGQGGTALMWCVAMNNLAAAKCLVAQGASPFTKNSGGNTPWRLAVTSRLVPFVRLFASCPPPDEKMRQEEAKEGIFISPLQAYIACGPQYLDRSMDLFRALWDIGALSREDAYHSAVEGGASSSRVLARLLETDYAESPDQDLLRGVLKIAAMAGDREAVRMILARLPRLELSSYTIAVFCGAIYSDQAGSVEVLKRLLDHCGPGWDINARFTHRYVSAPGDEPVLSDDDGVTLLHFALGRGRTSAGIELLSHGADPAVQSRDARRKGNGITPLGHLLFAQSNHNYLALRELVRSDFVRRDHPTFILDNAVVDERRNYNVFHHLCEGEDEQVHNHAGHKTAALRDLLDHCSSVVAGRPEAEERFRALLHARMRATGEEAMAPIHVAASNGFTEGISLLARQGVDVLDRVGVGCVPGFAGFTPLHFVLLRSPLVWEQNFKSKSRMLWWSRIPWIDAKGPVAANMKRDYQERTHECLGGLENLMKQSSEGREILKNRAAVL